MGAGNKTRRAWPVLVAALLLAVPASLLIAPPSALVAQDVSDVTNAEDAGVLTAHCSSIMMPSEMRDMALGDLNGDGTTDVVAANTSALLICLGQGNGSLGQVAKTLTRTGMGDIRSVAVGDLDGDGKDDIAATYTDAAGDNPKVTIFYQKVDFSTALDIGIYPDPQKVVVGRFNGSSYNDLAVACRGDPGEGVDASIYVVRWPFTKAWDAVQISVPEVADLTLLAAGYDGPDGRLDLVAGQVGGGEVLVLTQPATFTGTWSKRTVEIGGSLSGMQMVNYTGSGVRDLVVINGGEDRVEVRVNTGLGIPAPATSLVTSVGGASVMSLGRITGGDVPEMVLVSGDGICRVHSEGTVEHRFPLGDGTVEVQVLDRGSSVTGIYVLSSGGAGGSPALQFYPYAEGVIGNADGNVLVEGERLSHVVAGNLSFDAVAAVVDDTDEVVISDVSGHVLGHLPAQAGPCDLVISDLDGDGTGDLAVLNGEAGTVSVYRGGAGLLSKSAPDATITLGLSLPASLASGSIGAVGKSVLVVGGSGGLVVIYDALSSAVLESINGTAGSRTDVAMGRLTAGQASGGIAALNVNTGHIDLYYVKGSPTVGDCYADAPSAWLNMVGRSPTTIAVGDLNGDGRDDVAAGSGQGQVRTFLNSGLGFYSDTPATATLLASGAVGPVGSADLNDDGKDDLAVGYSTIAQVSVYLSTGPSFTHELDLAAGGAAGSIFAGDVDGDRREDVMACSDGGAVSFWLQNDLPPTAAMWLSPSPVEGVAMRFDGSNSSDSVSDRGSMSYYWSFGDGGTSTNVSGGHVYASDGAYDGYLEVTDRAGATARSDFHVNVSDAGPSAAIYLSSDTVHEGGLIGFYDSTSSSDAIATYRWDFGDGSPTVSTRDAEHRYLVKGTFNVTLTVWDVDGDQAGTNIAVTVLDLAPTASFTSSRYTLSEGEGALFSDTSYAYDGIASWSWDLGDGRVLHDQNVTASYERPGTYALALTIQDTEGLTSTYGRNITVVNTDPGAGDLVAGEGGVSFPMDGDITFRVTAWPTFLPITRYSWDLDYDPAEGFHESPGMSVNQTSWSYQVPGEYIICVRIYDASSYAERTLTVAVSDVPPTAVMVHQTAGTSNVTFDGSGSRDSLTDLPLLLYRWNFGDGSGWTGWSTESGVEHLYGTEGVYTATLEVEDQWGDVDSVTETVIIDASAPTIDLDNATVQTGAYAGEEVVVRVTITDVSTIGRVMLYYEMGDENGTLAMSRIAGTDTYVATIPPLKHTGTLSYHVEAEDTGGHVSESTVISVGVMERPSDMWLYLLAVVAVVSVVLLLLYFRITGMVVDEVFLIFRDGNLIAHQTRRLKPGMDDQIMGSMLVAIQDFVRDSFKEEASTGLNRMDFGERKVLVEKGENIYLAVVLHGKREGRVPQRMREAIAHTEEVFSATLADWDGDMEGVRGIGEEAGRLLRGSVLDLGPGGKKGSQS